MLTEIRDKVRALVNDIGTSQTTVETYSNSNIFTLCGGNVTQVTKVLINGNELASGESYTLDTATGKVTVDATLQTDDQVEITYRFYKYSDTELNEYIKSALVYLSIFGYCSDQDFEIEDEDIYPTPSNTEEDLISLVTSILIMPDYEMYKLSNVTVRYPRTIDKYKRIEHLICKFRRGDGVNDIIEWDNYRDRR
jgi:hypothetical protein